MELLAGAGIIFYLFALLFAIVWIVLPFYVRRIAIESKRHTEVLKAIHRQLKEQNQKLK